MTPRRGERLRKQFSKNQNLIEKSDGPQHLHKAKPPPEAIVPQSPPLEVDDLPQIIEEEPATELLDIDDAFFAGAANSGPSEIPTPSTLAEAFSGPNEHRWRGAFAEEMQNLVDNNVYEVVPTPAGMKPISTKPVMRIKLDSKGNVERYKLRIVARDFGQQGGNLKDTFAPVANLESIRLICMLAAKYDLELDQMDVSTAYLNGVLEDSIYVSPPEGTEIPEGHCWRLKKSLYGLKDAGRTWNRTLDAKLQALGACRLDAETCLYVFKGAKGDICYLVVYVDDLLLAASSRAYMDKIKALLTASFKMRDLGAASFLLGLEIQRDRKKRTISLSQTKYIDAILKRCGMTDCNPAKTPMATAPRLSAEDPVDNTTLLQQTINGETVSYPMVVGSIQYVVQGTRPDLAYLAGVLGRYSADPKACHWDAAKRGLRYLKYTRDLVLTFDGSDISGDMDFYGFSDSDWSGDIDTSRSTSGYAFISSRGALGWSSKRQAMVAQSSTESEYIGLSNAGMHLAWLRTFFAEVGHEQRGPTELFCDNQAAIILCKDPQFRARTKHIQRKYHFVRDDIVAKGEAVVRYVSTHDMVADILTKPLSREKHWKFAKAMGLRFISSGSVKTS
jgi:hypothetical protein